MPAGFNGDMRVPREEFTMKKLVLSLAAVAACACGGAWAQGADCQAGAAWGTPAGCGNPGDAPGYVYNNGAVYNNGVNVYNNSGWPPANSNAYPYGYAVPGILGALGFPQIVQSQRYPQYQASRGDRDGDGVRNRSDRYPDDPRYR
jgi:hypothetical protein